MSSPPPVAPQRPAAPGADPYAWMRDAGDPAMRAYLAAERSYYDQQMAHTATVRDRLRDEMSAREAPATESVSWRRGEYAYFTRTLPGREHEQFCRRRVHGPAAGGVPADADSAPAEVLLDENLLLDDPDRHGEYVALGVREVSPDGALLAYSVDFDGDEVYQLRIRDLASGQDLVTRAGLPERIERTYYGLAWSAGSRTLFYVVTNAAYRAYQVWRHDVGTDPAQDVLVFTEHDERFDVIVRATRSGAYILLETESRDTTETLVIPAKEPGAAPLVLQKRRPGVEYRADHADGPDGGEFYLVTNDEATEFRLVRGPVTPAAGPGGWTEVIAGSGGTRLVSCDVFGRFLVVGQRRDAATQLRVIDRETGEQRLIEAGGPEVALALAVNEEYRAAAVTVRTQSLIDPPSWHDVDLASGGWRLRKRQEVPGYDPGGYRTRRITAPAPDGTAIPVTVAYRAGLPQDGSAPCLLYGYGAYESCDWPEFSLPVVCLLDRGYLYAVAHVRGGGEGGRRWWLQGRLDHKRTTFTDFIAVADALAADKWAAGDAIVSRGLSAGGLLQGAVYSMAPRRWRAVVAEVPFVDVVNSMLDPTIPLTISEWDEWGDPREPAMRAYMESYSPYDNVPARPRPDLLVTGSLHDPRVLVHEPAKWVAKLRAASPDGADGTDGDGRVLFRPELGAAAHVGPSGRYGKLAYEAEILAFMLDAAGRGARDGRG
jgi:oligopeptidase B